MKFQLNNLQVDITKLVNDMRGPKGTAALTEEFQRISGELKKLRKEVEPKAKAQLKVAEAKYSDLLKKLQTAQKELDREVQQGITLVKKQAKSAKAAFSKKKATFTGKAKTSAKKASSKVKTTVKNKTSKKSSKKA